MDFPAHLSSEKASVLLKTYGKNAITSSKKIGAVNIFFSQFPTLINAILATAAVVSFFVHDALDAVFIVAILVLNGILGFVQEYKAEKSLEKLKTLLLPKTRVFRDGREREVNTEDIVPGDAVVLSEGERVPADGTIQSHTGLEIDESMLTGESLPVAKNEKDNAYSGTLVTKGKGFLLITATGNNSRLGQVAQTLSSIEQDLTPLQKRLATLGKNLSFLAICVSLLLIPIGIYHNQPLLPILLVAISIGIAAIPEGLPTVVTIALSLGTSRMAKHNAIVRKMPAVETLGAIQIIITDKTGTLTQNNMVVKKHWLANKDALTNLLHACVLGNTATVIEKANDKKEIIGDRTDAALLLFASEHGTTQKDVLQKGKIVDEFVFDPQTKTVTTIFKLGQKTTVFVRGAAEEILAKSTLSDKEKKTVEKEIHVFAKEGLRIIGFGTKHIAKPVSRKAAEENVTFLGFVGIYDPPRAEAKDAVRQAIGAGIIPIMVTGDNEVTAVAIAKEVGIMEGDEEVITGEILRKLSDAELSKLLLKTRVFARTQPEDKLRLVNLFRSLGYVVGVTGDGVNDSLALKQADVGVSMGLRGTDVAKEASDIVLTDDNFATLVKAIEEGRRIYDNILKSITYLLSGNLAEISVVLLASLANLPAPLLPTQILWMNLVTDGLPALALAGDRKDPDLLKRKPHLPNTPILTRSRLIFVGIVGLGIAQVVVLVYAFLLKDHSQTFARTVAFNLIIFLHVGIVLAVRGKAAFQPNNFLVFVFVLTFVLQYIITTVPFFQNIFHMGLK